MNAMEILGDLLGRKTSKPGRGADVLKDIFRRGTQSAETSPPKSSGDINREAAELERLLNVAGNRSASRTSRSTPSIPSRQTSPSPRQQEIPTSNRFDRDRDLNQPTDNDRAIVLIRAMVNASKADGRIDQSEQNKIVEQIGSKSREAIDFLRQEFSQPLDVQAFVQSVPLGMEQQVYSMSLIAIDLDEQTEANYLDQLGHALRIPVEVRKQIHQRLGVPGY